MPIDQYEALEGIGATNRGASLRQNRTNTIRALSSLRGLRVPTFAVRETASLGIMGAPRVPPLNPSETIVL